MMSLISVTVGAMALVCGVVFCQEKDFPVFCPEDARVCLNPNTKCLWPIAVCPSYWCCYENKFGGWDCQCKNTDLDRCRNMLPLKRCKRMLRKDDNCGRNAGPQGFLTRDSTCI